MPTILHSLQISRPTNSSPNSRVGAKIDPARTSTPGHGYDRFACVQTINFADGHDRSRHAIRLKAETLTARCDTIFRDWGAHIFTRRTATRANYLAMAWRFARIRNYLWTLLCYYILYEKRKTGRERRKRHDASRPSQYNYCMRHVISMLNDYIVRWNFC